MPRWLSTWAMTSTTRPAEERQLAQRQQIEDGVYRDRPGRDRGTTRQQQRFDPVIVKKQQRRLTGVDEIVLSLTAKGLTAGKIAAIS